MLDSITRTKIYLSHMTDSSPKPERKEMVSISIFGQLRHIYYVRRAVTLSKGILFLRSFEKWARDDSTGSQRDHRTRCRWNAASNSHTRSYRQTDTGRRGLLQLPRHSGNNGSRRVTSALLSRADTMFTYRVLALLLNTLLRLADAQSSGQYDSITFSRAARN